MDEIEDLNAFSGLDESLRLIGIGVDAARAELKKARDAWVDRKPIGTFAQKIGELGWKIRNEAIFLPRGTDKVRSVARANDAKIKEEGE